MISILMINFCSLCYGLLAYPDFDKQFEKSDIVVVGHSEKVDFAYRIDKDSKLMSSSDYWIHTFKIENILKGEDELKSIYILDKEKGGFDAPCYQENKKLLLFLKEVKLSDTEREEYRLLVVTEEKPSNKKKVEFKRLLEGKYFETPFWRNGTIILDDDKLESKKISDEAKEFIKKKEKKKEKVPVKKD